MAKTPFSLPSHQWGYVINNFKGNTLPIDQGPILEGMDSDGHKIHFAVYIYTITCNKRATNSPPFTSKIQLASVVSHQHKWGDSLASKPQFHQLPYCAGTKTRLLHSVQILHSLLRLHLTDCNGNTTLNHDSTYTKSASVHILLTFFFFFFPWGWQRRCN